MLKEFVADNISVGSEGHLYFAGQDTVELAKEFGTPLYLMDEDRIRHNCRMYKAAFRKHFGEGSYPLYASKSNSFMRIYQIMKEEDMGIDVVSPGELFTALQAGYDLSRAYFHGNNKTDFDIAFGIEHKVGYFIADSMDELDAIEDAAKNAGITQKILIRLTPGIDSHTLAAISTGQIDSKFGVVIANGQAEEALLHALSKEHIEVAGFHCHIGSQIFTEDVFERAASIMLEFISDMEKNHGFKTGELNLGGGYGVRYVKDDPYLNIEEKISDVAEVINRTCSELGIDRPEIRMEPGRSIVADAGMTIYSVGSVKTIPQCRTFVSVDGSMADNIRYALYKAKYTCLSASMTDIPHDMECSLVGRCCESGDVIQDCILLPSETKRGDYVAVCTTGAYNYSMSSNYNRLTKPPIVMLRGGTDRYVAVKRETFDDIVRNDVI